MANNVRRLLVHVCLVLLMTLVLGRVASASPQSGIIPVGSGSYTTVRPETCEPLQDQIFKVASLSGPTPTNQWWSSLVWDKFSNNMFPHPLGVVTCEEGLSLSYPGAAIVAAEMPSWEAAFRQKATL